MKFITPGRVYLIGPKAFGYIYLDSLVRLPQKSHADHMLILASLDSVTRHFEGRSLQAVGILSAAAEVWSVGLRLLVGNGRT